MTKKILTILVLILIGSVGFAQQKPKPKDKPPTQKEIDEMMREAQKEMEGLSEEEKKMMEDMGVKMPDLKNIPKFTDQQIQEVAYAGEFFIPKKDLARIALVNKKIFSSSELTTHVKNTAAKVESRMDAKKLTVGKQAYTDIKTRYKDSGAVATAASGYWMLGVLQPAIYLMGRACQDDPTNPDHLNNYAAFLSMARAEELALPILLSLNKDYPKNSTIMNNIGHAWLGLGDVALAEKYLDSTIMIFPNHSQANYTKGLVKNAQGNTTAATTAMKRSIKRAYSDSKKSMLNDLGYKLNNSDMDWNLRMPQEALLLSTIEWPDYPKTAQQSELQQSEWDAYQNKLNNQASEFLAQHGKKFTEDAAQQNIQAALQNKNTGQYWLAPKAFNMLEYTLSAKSGAVSKLKEKEIELEAVAKKVAELEDKRDRELALVHQEFKSQMGEGKPNPFGAYCAKLTAAQNGFLNSANPILEKAYKGYIESYQKMVNEKVYYQQFMFSETDMEGIKLYEKARWVTVLANHPVRFETPNHGVCRTQSENHIVNSSALAEFNDLHCNNIISFDIVIAKWRKACDKSTYDIGVGPIKFNMDYNDWKEEIIRGSVEVGISKSIGTSSGPLKAELEANIGGFVEFDNTGLTDVGIIAGAEVKAGVGVDVPIKYDGEILGMKTEIEYDAGIGRELSVGVNTRMGWNSGGSVKVFAK